MTIGGAAGRDVSPDFGLLVVAALDQELALARELARHPERIVVPGVRAWRAEARAGPIAFLESGIGPVRAEASLDRFLGASKPARILVIGYGGGLAAELEAGALVALERASLLRPAEEGGSEQWSVAGTWPLDGTAIGTGGLGGLTICRGDGLTTSCLIGSPEEKRRLRERFGAAVIDMETAALARTAGRAGVPIGCVRAISDTADDTFLAPFGCQPKATPLARAARIVSAGGWLRRYRTWRDRSRCARTSLRRFLVGYLESGY